jgi:NAD(P)-dependent dehydrogenase (short-subunit alcohol dehydrogenase family)
VRRALVFGGTGAVGAAVLRELARRSVPAVFTYHRAAERAHALALELGHTAQAIDLADPVATRAMLDAQPSFDIVIHCAGVSAGLALAEIDLAAYQQAMAVNVQSAFVACQWLAARAQPCDVVLVGGLDRTQSLPLPVHFAATQGALSAMVMAVAHEVGRLGIRINLVALGVLDAGLSAGLATRRRKDYETFSALRRAGKPDEAAKLIAWLALENTYVQGKVISANGGI